ncbi:MAG: peptidase [Candidatus Neomarinimicrobiota bacterium]
MLQIIRKSFRKRATVLSVIMLTGIGMVMTLNNLNCGGNVNAGKADIMTVKAELNKLAPVELKCDLSTLSPADRQVLVRLIEAGRIIDQLFLLQVNPENPEILAKLQTSTDDNDKPYLDMFNVMFGPWNRLDHDKPFIGKKEKPLGAGFYPEDMSKEEFEKFVAENPDQKKAFESEFTVIKRQDGQLTAVPYFKEYEQYIDALCTLLTDAASITADPTLKKYLNQRVADLRTDDYFQSDMDWMDLAGDLEIVIGPYEVYEDNLFNYKASYEAFICVVDHAESAKLAQVSKYLDEIEANLPLPKEYRNYSRGKVSPVKVVQEIFSAGDTKAGIQTTAFNLPNDERVRSAKGSKKVMLKNVAEAKYEKCWIPIVNEILAPEPLKNVSFNAYFTDVLMHEVCHGLGPGILKMKDGSETTVRNELKDYYSTIEECKADVLGIFSYLYLIDKGVFPNDPKYTALATYLGGMFRSIRFGINEAHGGGVAIQFNYFIEKGAFLTDADGKLTIDAAKLEKAIKELSAELLLIEAKGDYEGAKTFIAKYRVATPLITETVKKLEYLPVDIRPIYPIAL